MVRHKKRTPPKVEPLLESMIWVNVYRISGGNFSRSLSNMFALNKLFNTIERRMKRLRIPYYRNGSLLTIYDPNDRVTITNHWFLSDMPIYPLQDT